MATIHAIWKYRHKTRRLIEKLFSNFTQSRDAAGKRQCHCRPIYTNECHNCDDWSLVNIPVRVVWMKCQPYYARGENYFYEDKDVGETCSSCASYYISNSWLAESVHAGGVEYIQRMQPNSSFVLHRVWREHAPYLFSLIIFLDLSKALLSVGRQNDRHQ